MLTSLTYLNKEEYQQDRVITYTADDEEPDCMHCDFMDQCDGKHCGPEYGWANYVRFEEKKNVRSEKSI